MSSSTSDDEGMELTPPEKILFVNMSSSTNNDEEMELIQPDNLTEAKNAQDGILPLPPKSREKYMATYDNFILWKKQRKIKTFSENVLLAYFRELSGKYKPSSLWSIYSMLKSTLNTNKDADLRNYRKLSAFMKLQSDGFVSRKSKVLTTVDVEKYLNEAPDEKYLLTKVILIFGITGGMRLHELTNMDISDIEFHGELLLVKVPNTNNKIPRTFTINGKFCEIVKKYIGLRVTMKNSTRFFQKYQHGRCFRQNVGVNKIGSIPKHIATFLKLPNPEEYAGRCFRRTSAALLGADIKTKRHRGLRSAEETEGYKEDSMENKTKIADQTTDCIKIELCPSPTPEGPSFETSSTKSWEELSPPASPSRQLKFSDTTGFEKKTTTCFENKTTTCFEKKTTEKNNESIRFERSSTRAQEQITLNFTNCSNLTVIFEK